MKTRIITLIFLFITVLEAVPTDYESCARLGKDDDVHSPVFIENRIGVKRGFKRHSKINSKTCEPGEFSEDEDEMNGLFKSFWAVDNLPRRSTFVSIKKLPDVYMEQDDQPSPIADLIPVEQSEITEEARVMREPVFAEPQFYNPSLNYLSNGGNQIHNKPLYHQNHVRVAPGYMGLNSYYYNTSQSKVVPASNISPKLYGKTILPTPTTENINKVKSTTEQVKIDLQKNCTVSENTSKGTSPAPSLEHIEIIPKKNPPKLKPESTTVVPKSTTKKCEDKQKSDSKNIKQDVKP